MNINDLFQGAEGAEDDAGFPELLGPEELPEGTVVLCEITFSKAKTRPANQKTGKGPAKSWNNKLKVIEPGHPAAGGEFFDSIHLSGGDLDGNITDNQHAYNKRLFAKLQGAGLTGQFFSQNPSDEAIAKALVGKKVRVTLHWQDRTAEQERQGKNPFLDNTTTWEPADGAGGSGGYVPGAAATKGF